MPKAPFYLVGSIHALSKKDYPLPTPYDIALKESTRFVFEFDPSRHAEFEKKFEAAAKYPPGQDIRSKINPELLAWLRKNILTVKPDARDGKRERVGASTASFVTNHGGLHSTWPHRQLQQDIRLAWLGQLFCGSCDECWERR